MLTKLFGYIKLGGKKDGPMQPPSEPKSFELRTKEDGQVVASFTINALDDIVYWHLSSYQIFLSAGTGVQMVEI